MTPAEEHHLYQSNRPAWLAHVAPRMAATLDTNTDQQLDTTWARMPRDYQRATWTQLQPETQQRLAALRATAKPTEA